MSSREDIVQRIVAERERQIELPGLEYDVQHGPNEWVTIVAHYLFEEIRRGAGVPSQSEFEDSMVKAGAVILAALEYSGHMQKHDRLS